MFWHKGWRVEGDYEFPIGQNQERSFLGLDGDGDGDGDASLSWFQWIRGKEKEHQETSLARTVTWALGEAKAEQDTVLSRLWESWCDAGVLTRSSIGGKGGGYVLDWERLRFDAGCSCGVRVWACTPTTAGSRPMLTCSKQVQAEERAPTCRVVRGNLFATVEHTAQWGNKHHW
jgi:hypothetical protein